MRTWIIALAALMVIPAVGAAATIVTRPVEEQLVEGHTVFTVIEVVRNTTTAREEFHAAVAVLVREVDQQVRANRFPGVLWFNDQYLVNPQASIRKVIDARYPCTGSVIAVDASYGIDPRDEFASATPPTYVESYHITDPNDRVWDVDKWLGSDGFIWTVAIKNNQAGYNQPDDGKSDCAPYQDMGSCTIPGPAGARNTASLGVLAGETSATNPGPSGAWCKYRYYDPGRHTDTDPTASEDWIGMGYPCGQDRGAPGEPGNRNCLNLLYNALLYFRMQDLSPADAGAPKDHNDGSLDRQRDVSGCHPSYGYYGENGNTNYGSGYSTPSGQSSDSRSWPCPYSDLDGDGVVEPHESDDNREGNSHAYNPELPWPLVSYDGRKNHGGSDDCDGDGQPDNPAGRTDYTGDYNCHATQNIRLYYHHNPAPALRTFYLIDIEGSSAPFHCHDAREVCNLSEFLADPASYPNDYASTADDLDDSS